MYQDFPKRTDIPDFHQTQPEELSYEGYVFTAMRIVNAIPHVCAGKPGILTIHDFPMALPDNAFRSEATHIIQAKIPAFLPVQVI